MGRGADLAWVALGCSTRVALAGLAALGAAALGMAARAGRLRFLVNRLRSTLYFALETGCIARLARLIGLGVTARRTVRTGCVARRTDRGTRRLVRNPTLSPSFLPRGSEHEGAAELAQASAAR